MVDGCDVLFNDARNYFGFSVTAGGYEYNLAIIAVVLGVMLTGQGSYILF